MRHPVKNISELAYCYGCGVCTAVCPVSIISMRENKDGFYEPFIKNQCDCIDCGACIRTCSFCSEHKENTENHSESFAAWSLDEDIRKASSSGGISFEIARRSFEEGFKAVGARYSDKNKRVEHFIASSLDDFGQSIGSKYLQSFTENAFREIDFKGRWLVTGTPCQIASLRRLIRMRNASDRFILVDFFCHGVPSRLLWIRYLKKLSLKGIDVSRQFSWRDKTDGWHDSWVISTPSYRSRWSKGDLFFNIFLGNYCLNRCCYADCRFKGLSSEADLRLGDFWGTKFADNKDGVSALISFTDTGRKMVESLQKTCHIENVGHEDTMDGQIKKHYPYPAVARFMTLASLRAGLPLDITDIIRRVAHHF